MQPVVIDTETTGVDPAKDHMVELAAVWEDTRGQLREFSSLCNPGVAIPPEAMAVHHITDEMLPSDVTPEGMMDNFVLNLFGDGTDDLEPVFVAHNAEFDKAVLSAVSPGFAKKPWICTWRCALHLWPDAPGFGNQVLRYWKKLKPPIPTGLYPHRALYDIIVTREILKEMLKEKRPEELIELTNKPALLKNIRFGKHRGMAWSDVPKDYLRWVSSQNMDADTLHTARYWLKK